MADHSPAGRSVSIGPRLFSHGNYRGSGRPEAERPSFQLGHDFSAMEIWIQGGQSYKGVTFQLGHDFSAMEILLRMGFLTPICCSFNWATTFQPWKWCRRPGEGLRCPGFNWATTFQPWKCPPPAHHRPRHGRVSIGPRLFSHGNPGNILSDDRGSARFQLGHDFSAMEMPAHCPNCHWRWSFQLGHDFSAMEITSWIVMLDPAGECFNWATTFQPWKFIFYNLLSYLLFLFQLGHDFSAMEIISRDVKIEENKSSFNWATTFQPWKLHLTCLCRVSSFRFNWATTFQPWKYKGASILMVM